jgi:hypothetical protein
MRVSLAIYVIGVTYRNINVKHPRLLVPPRDVSASIDLV